MTKTSWAYIITALTATTLLGFSSLALYGFHNYLYDLYPELNRKLVRKAFRSMMWKALTGKISVPEHLTDRQMEDLFLLEVLEVCSSK